MIRTHTCGELGSKNIDEQVVLTAWVNRRRDHGDVIFIDLRDRYGITQVVFDPSNDDKSHKIADSVRSEFVLKISGVVRARPEDQENPNLKTGKIEILANEIEILNKAKTPPFEINNDKKVNEDIRLKYRYLDIRKDKIRDNIILRANMTKLIRDHFYNEGFIDVETPIMVKGTPEGSREYLVPSRLHHGKFYVLPQSPQQLKQLLMVGGIDKYFQVARCFRDEDQRGDRQPEFTQFEIEMSFCEQEDIIQVIEKSFIKLTEKFASDKKYDKKFQRITYKEAMCKYGSDKPDLRFDLEFVDLTKFAKNSGFGIFEKSEYLFALRIDKNLGTLTRKDIDKLTELAIQNGAGGLAWLKIGEKSGPVAKNSKADFLETIKKETKANDGDLIFFGAGIFTKATEPLGAVRSDIGGRFGLKDENVFKYLWVYDFPMFEKNDSGEIGAVHHPFTRPHPDDADILEIDPLKARAIAYDVVLNGVELGGGSMRIHEPDLQKKIFNILNISDEDAERRFGHLLKAFSFGAPPHGGCAMGLDRVVMLFAGEPNIREVIAFPKNQTAQDLMFGAPSEMPKQDIEDLGIQIIED